MDTETFLAYAGIKGSPGTLGTQKKLDLNPCCRAGLVFGGKLAEKGVL